MTIWERFREKVAAWFDCRHRNRTYYDVGRESGYHCPDCGRTWTGRDLPTLTAAEEAAALREWKRMTGQR